MDSSIFSPLAWLVAGQFGLYALGWGLLSLILRNERGAVAHWAAFMLLIGLGFLLAANRGAERLWWPYVGSSLAYVAAFAALRRGLELFLRIPPSDRELLVVVGLVSAALVASGPGTDTASLRVTLTYGSLVWMLGSAVAKVAAPAKEEFGWPVLVAIGVPAGLVTAGFSARVVQQLLDWSHPLEMQLSGGINGSLLFAYLCGAAIFNFSFMGLVTVRLVTALRQQARHDALTGLPNRRELETRLADEWQRHQLGGTGFAVLALDLDHFKRVNDVHGHLAGDSVLVQMGQRLRATLGKRDTLARTGGEEFVALLPGADLRAAQVAGERLLASVRGQDFEIDDQSLHLTVSAGLSCAQAGDTRLREVLQRSDEALYRAKDKGRDRLEVAAG